MPAPKSARAAARVRRRPRAPGGRVHRGADPRRRTCFPSSRSRSRPCRASTRRPGDVRRASLLHRVLELLERALEPAGSVVAVECVGGDCGPLGDPPRWPPHDAGQEDDRDHGQEGSTEPAQHAADARHHGSGVCVDQWAVQAWVPRRRRARRAACWRPGRSRPRGPRLRVLRPSPPPSRTRVGIARHRAPRQLRRRAERLSAAPTASERSTASIVATGLSPSKAHESAQRLVQQHAERVQVARSSRRALQPFGREIRKRRDEIHRLASVRHRRRSSRCRSHSP